MTVIYLPNMAEIISPLVAGGVGGLIAQVGSTFLIQYLRRPKISISDLLVRTIDVEADGPDDWLFRAAVTNNGRTAAENCKAELELQGRSTMPYLIHEERLVYYIVSVDTTVPWSEGDNPARITINPGETATFDLFGGTAANKVLVPSAQGWSETTPFQLKKVVADPEAEIDPVSATATTVEERQSIDRTTFDRLDWQIARLSVTSQSRTDARSDLSIMTDDRIHLQLERNHRTRG